MIGNVCAGKGSGKGKEPVAEAVDGDAALGSAEIDGNQGSLELATADPSVVGCERGEVSLGQYEVDQGRAQGVQVVDFGLEFGDEHLCFSLVGLLAGDRRIEVNEKALEPRDLSLYFRCVEQETAEVDAETVGLVEHNEAGVVLADALAAEPSFARVAGFRVQFWHFFKMNRNLRTLILALPELDVNTLKQIWKDNESLRKYFVGISIEIDGKPLLLLSEDFCRAIFTTLWDFGHQLAMVLMEEDFIDYSAHVIRQLGINDPLHVAEIVMRNGRIAALDAVPQREKVLEQIFKSRGQVLFMPFISSELYELTYYWDFMFGGRLRIDQLLCLVLIASTHRARPVIDWVGTNLHLLTQLDENLFKSEIREYPNRLRLLLSKAQDWGYGPAIALVQLLIDY